MKEQKEKWLGFNVPMVETIEIPFSCFRRFRLLHILTAHMLRMMATMKNKIPPTTPAVIALCLTRAGTGNFVISLMPWLVAEWASTLK